MEIKDWITLFSAILLAAGWFVNGQLNRSNEIAKKRLEHRIPMLKSFLKIWYFIQDNDLTDQKVALKYKALIIEVREEFHLYGEKDEIILFEQFVESGIGKNVNPQKARESLEKLVKLVRERIRKELKIE